MKNPKIKAQLEAFTKRVFGRGREESIKKEICVTCGGPATSFKDELSIAEYAISGMCQTCQDEVFK